jgi:hypothetical protein
MRPYYTPAEITYLHRAEKEIKQEAAIYNRQLATSGLSEEDKVNRLTKYIQALRANAEFSIGLRKTYNQRVVYDKAQKKLSEKIQQEQEKVQLEKMKLAAQEDAAKAAKTSDKLANSQNDAILSLTHQPDKADEPAYHDNELDSDIFYS